MNKLAIEFGRHLDSEIRLYEFYLKFLIELQAEIISGNTEMIEKMIINIKFSERDFTVLRDERLDIMHRIVNHDGEVLFLELSDVFTNDNFEALLEKRNNLNELIEEVRHLNEVNKIILENALLFTKQRLNIFSQPSNDSYNHRGKSKEKVFKNSMDWSV